MDTPTLEREMNRLRGRVLGMIEGVNLPDRQERAIKQTFKALTYDTEKVIREEIIPNEVARLT